MARSIRTMDQCHIDNHGRAKFDLDVSIVESSPVAAGLMQRSDAG
ncbi:MAG: hypothetical protein ACRDTC_22160 [Pseudonocardiaceae bacterium]